MCQTHWYKLQSISGKMLDGLLLGLPHELCLQVLSSYGNNRSTSATWITILKQQDWNIVDHLLKLTLSISRCKKLEEL